MRRERLHTDPTCDQCTGFCSAMGRGFPNRLCFLTVDSDGGKLDGLGHTLANQVSPKLHKALKSGEDLLDFDLEIPGAVRGLGTPEHLSQEHGIVVFHAHGRGDRDPLGRVQAETLSWHSTHSAGYGPFGFVTRTSNLDYGRAFLIVQAGCHDRLIG